MKRSTVLLYAPLFGSALFVARTIWHAAFSPFHEQYQSRSRVALEKEYKKGNLRKLQEALNIDIHIGHSADTDKRVDEMALKSAPTKDQVYEILVNIARSVGGGSTSKKQDNAADTKGATSKKSNNRAKNSPKKTTSKDKTSDKEETTSSAKPKTEKHSEKSVKDVAALPAKKEASHAKEQTAVRKPVPKEEKSTTGKASKTDSRKGVDKSKSPMKAASKTEEKKDVSKLAPTKETDSMKDVNSSKSPVKAASKTEAKKDVSSKLTATKVKHDEKKNGGDSDEETKLQADAMTTDIPHESESESARFKPHHITAGDVKHALGKFAHKLEGELEHELHEMHEIHFKIPSIPLFHREGSDSGATEETEDTDEEQHGVNKGNTDGAVEHGSKQDPLPDAPQEGNKHENEDLIPKGDINVPGEGIDPANPGHPPFGGPGSVEDGGGDEPSTEGSTRVPSDGDKPSEEPNTVVTDVDQNGDVNIPQVIPQVKPQGEGKSDENPSEIPGDDGDATKEGAPDEDESGDDSSPEKDTTVSSDEDESGDNSSPEKDTTVSSDEDESGDDSSPEKDTTVSSDGDDSGDANTPEVDTTLSSEGDESGKASSPDVDTQGRAKSDELPSESKETTEDNGDTTSEGADTPDDNESKGNEEEKSDRKNQDTEENGVSTSEDENGFVKPHIPSKPEIPSKPAGDSPTKEEQVPGMSGDESPSGEAPPVDPGYIPFGGFDWPDALKDGKTASGAAPKQVDSKAKTAEIQKTDPLKVTHSSTPDGKKSEKEAKKVTHSPTSDPKKTEKNEASNTTKASKASAPKLDTKQETEDDKQPPKNDKKPDPKMAAENKPQKISTVEKKKAATSPIPKKGARADPKKVTASKPAGKAAAKDHNKAASATKSSQKANVEANDFHANVAREYIAPASKQASSSFSAEVEIYTNLDDKESDHVGLKLFDKASGKILAERPLIKQGERVYVVDLPEGDFELELVDKDGHAFGKTKGVLEVSVNKQTLFDAASIKSGGEKREFKIRSDGPRNTALL